jgi:hypothetical protein
MNQMQAIRSREYIAARLTNGALSDLAHIPTALRLRNRRWYPFIFLICLAAPIVAWFRFASGRRPELLISAIGAIGGFFYFLYTQHLNETKLFKELFIEFNLRYDNLKDGLNAILFGPTEGLLSSDEREELFNFFNLCAEEYFFYKAGYIDRDVWRSWYRGMGIFFAHPRIGTLWEQDCKADSYYGFQPPQ